MGDFLFALCLIFSILKIISPARDTISVDDPLHEHETIISSGGTFEMGFFRPSSSNRYVGIWYKKIPMKTVVWVANRKAPLSTNASSVVLKIVNPSQLTLLSDTNDVVLSVNTTSSSLSRSPQNPPVMQLLDSGNLVVLDGLNPENMLWQSFDYPTDTLLPGMKMGKNFVTGHEVYLTAWKSADDPYPSEYTQNLLVTGYPQVIIRQGRAINYRMGPWDGAGWGGFPSPDTNPIYRSALFMNKTETNANFSLVIDNRQIYTQFSLLNQSIISVAYINYTGVVHRLFWVDGMSNWITLAKLPTDECDTYARCGRNGVCNINNNNNNNNFPVCRCLDYFFPRNQLEWELGNFSGGCVRKRSLECHNNGTDDKPGGLFFKYSGIKLPDTQYSLYYQMMTLQECKQECFNNCSCTAYSSLGIRGNGGTSGGCLVWFGDLVDIRHMSKKGQDIYIRLASSELVSDSGSRREHKRILERVAVSLSSSVIGLILIGLSLMLYMRRKKKKTEEVLLDDKEFELPFLPFHTIARATNNFSADNKLGAGGFGPVYKGVLENGQEIAVKRLSKTSAQGLNELKNEIIFIAKLQHRNLVSLLGCCIQGEEHMLIYEYMPNRSLDLFIFDHEKKKLLDWRKRFNIINGIARGLMYLHQDSRLRIIHRDLKASNILLDIDMNPKISDFGLARSVMGNATGGDTSRVVGTHGYMSPEYVVFGVYSVKSDVFSFGVSVLEIVSGMRNKGFFIEDQFHTLLWQAWKLHGEGRSVELVDQHLAAEPAGDLSQVLRSIHVGLLCVQQHPDDRPTMSEVVQMLTHDAVLPEPKEPGFFTGRPLAAASTQASSSSTQPVACSINQVSLSLIDPR